MDDEIRTRLWAGLVAGAAALLVGLTSFLTQLAGGPMATRILTLAIISLALATVLGAFLGFCWVFLGEDLLSRLGIMDWIAATAVIGIGVVPMAPRLSRIVERFLTRLGSDQK